MTAVLFFKGFNDVCIQDIVTNKPVSLWAAFDHEDQDASPSQVAIHGEMVDRPELRQSKSVRDRYTISHLSTNIRLLFTKIKVGLGSKHIYAPGDFMKEHYDTRLPDESTTDLKHITVVAA